MWTDRVWCFQFPCCLFVFACVQLMAGYTLDNAFIWPDKAHIAFSNEIIIARDRPTRCINYMPALFVATRRRINGSINYVDDAVASRIDAENTRPIPIYIYMRDTQKRTTPDIAPREMAWRRRGLPGSYPLNEQFYNKTRYQKWKSWLDVSNVHLRFYQSKISLDNPKPHLCS